MLCNEAFGFRCWVGRRGREGGVSVSRLDNHRAMKHSEVKFRLI